MQIRKYESFIEEPVNEELIGEIIKAAKGALKGFLTNITTPFKNLKDDFKKGLKTEQAKTRFIQGLDTILKNATDGIQKAKDEAEINSMTDAFFKQIAEQEADFDKEIKSIKEGAEQTPGTGGQAKNAMIAGKVMMGMVRDQFQKMKVEFDKRYASAKDLAAKKQVAIQRLRDTIETTKKKLNDPKTLETAIRTYKNENKIEGGSAGISADILKTYNSTKSEELVGKEVRYKTKKYDPNKKPEEQPENIGKLKVLRVEPDGIFFDGEKEDFKKPFDQILPATESGANAKKAQEVLTRIKNNDDKMGKVAKFAEFVEKDENKDKVAEIEKIIGGVTTPTA